MSNVTENNTSSSSSTATITTAAKEEKESATIIINKKKNKETWIPLSPTTQEYVQRDLKPRQFPEDVNRDTQTRLIQEKYTRKINAIYWVRTDDDKEWLNWDETREGKTRMGRKVEFDVPHMGKKKVPIPNEELEFDMETEEYKTVITGEKEHRLEYFVPYNADNVAELLQDINPYKTAFYIKHEGQRTFDITKEELLSKNFAKLYDAKSRRLITK